MTPSNTPPNNTPTIQIELQNAAEWERVPSIEHMQTWLSLALQQEQGECVLRIVDLDEGRSLNHDYRGKDYATNILSFPNELPDFDLEPELMAELDQDYLGDLVVCAAVVEREAQEQGKPLEQHWAHLLIHGLLHLQGYDHLTEAEAEVMEALEITILGKLGIPNPYLINQES
ncbi:rRNA maturation RNase YbeY [Thiofilum flexile]|uniref:rRNA maturation RNase YbeY n=1 Tax=Thiofilum flexile TaxID=125627 RepID=UPI000364C347|nr:rRNA maturation RNase YbeY [Thiofilum flexile]